MSWLQMPVYPQSTPSTRRICMRRHRTYEMAGILKIGPMAAGDSQVVAFILETALRCHLHGPCQPQGTKLRCVNVQARCIYCAVTDRKCFFAIGEHRHGQTPNPDRSVRSETDSENLDSFRLVYGKRGSSLIQLLRACPQRRLIGFPA